MSNVIETERLTLRRYTLHDLDVLCEVFSDSYSRRFYPKMVTREKVLGWIQWNLRNYEETGFGLWAMETHGGSRLIGDCGLTYQEVEGRRELEIGYHLHEAERGKGYATEAARACLAYAFRALDALLVCSIVDPQNTASGAVASRVHRNRREFLKDGRAFLLFYTEKD
jgi:RimJ/RimL family protein N-acetyltransferase